MTIEREQELILKGQIEALKTFLKNVELSHTKTYKRAKEELKELIKKNELIEL